MAKQETDILNRWRLKWAKWAILFRNNVGSAWNGIPAREWEARESMTYVQTKPGKRYLLLEEPRRITFGLIKGSGDYVGWRTMVVTPEMVGKKVAVFTSVEGKTKDGRLEDEQRIWLMNVRRAGGIAMVVREPDQPPCEWEAFE